MNFSPVITKREARVAFDSLRSCLIDGAEQFRRNVGWPGGHDEFTVHWYKRYGVRAVAEILPHLSHYWCAFGTMDPNQYRNSVNITCEINPPFEGIDRRCGGILLKDSSSALYLGHSGKVGGGRKGIGKNAFLESYNGNLNDVEWPDGKSAEVVVVGKIGGRFITNLASYVRTVEAFKVSATRLTPASIVRKNLDLLFTPEFEGPRKKYQLTTAIESRCDHGTVVNTLHAALKASGLDAYSTGKIDLYLADDKSNISHVFEVKTDQTTTSLYQAVGQVVLHSALEESNPKRILVLPSQVSSDTATRMKRLGTRVLHYEWKDEAPVFNGLEEALR